MLSKDIMLQVRELSECVEMLSAVKVELEQKLPMLEEEGICQDDDSAEGEEGMLYTFLCQCLEAVKCADETTKFTVASKARNTRNTCPQKVHCNQRPKRPHARPQCIQML